MFRYRDDVLSLNNSRSGDFVDYYFLRRRLLAFYNVFFFDKPFFACVYHMFLITQL
jgi:hypothetical protein